MGQNHTLPDTFKGKFVLYCPLMKRINIAQLGSPSPQRQAWIRGLADAGYQVSAVNPMELEQRFAYARPGDVVLLDGMLPHLRHFIERTCTRCPEAHVIVVTDEYSFSIYYEVLHHGGATYFSGPMNADQFTETIREIAEHDESHAALRAS